MLRELVKGPDGHDRPVATALGQTAEDQMGRIVNIASQAGQGGDRAEAMSYGATKAALINPT